MFNSKRGEKCDWSFKNNSLSSCHYHPYILPKPFEIFEDVKKALRLGGWLAVYAPYIDQAETAYRIAKKIGFRDLTILETLEREMEIRPQGTRPKTRMVGHSGYLVFARKL